MNPLARFSASVALTLVLGFPTLSSGLRGDTTLAAASMRFLVLFVFARVVVRGCATLVERYAAPILEAESAAAAAAAEEARLRLLADEVSADDAGTSDLAADPGLLDPTGVDRATASAA